MDDKEQMQSEPCPTCDTGSVACPDCNPQDTAPLNNENVASLITVLTDALQKDPDYRIGWQANIAMAFFDECRRHPAWSQGRAMTHEELHQIANTSADNFLKALCYKPQPKPEEIRDREELVETFEPWFTRLLLREGSTCLVRDVLRNLKKVMREEWINCRPIYTTTDIQHSKAEAKRMRKSLGLDGQS